MSAATGTLDKSDSDGLEMERSRAGRILWVRGLTRVQTQVFSDFFYLAPEDFLIILYFFQLRVIRAFKSTLEDMEEKRSEHSARSFRSLQSGLMRLLPDVDEDPLLNGTASPTAKLDPVQSPGKFCESKNSL